MHFSRFGFILSSSRILSHPLAANAHRWAAETTSIDWHYLINHIET
jgi:hypothetical protein